MATVALVGITGRYAYSTRQLLGVTREQTGATRASYAPNLDLPGWPYGIREAVRPNGFDLSVVNRGLGVGKNIELSATITAGGRTFRYVGLVDESLREGRCFDMDVEPHFLVPTATVRALGDDPEAYLPVTDAGREHCKIPLVELVALLDRDDRFRDARVDAAVTYHDVHGLPETEQLVDDEPLDLGQDNLELAVGRRPDGYEPPGWIGRGRTRVGHAWRTLLGTHPPIYREGLEVEIRDVDQPVPTEGVRGRHVGLPGIGSV